MRRALVTGATGHIGIHLCRRLSREGLEVHATSRKPQPHDPSPEFVWWQSDLRDVDATRKLLLTVKPEVIFHLAGCVTGGRGLEVVRPTFEHNLIATVNLLMEATEAGSERIVLAGSLEEPRESAVEPCSSPYAASKWAVRSYARMFYSLYRTPVVNTRIFMVYGPGSQPATRFIPYVISSLLSGQAPKLSSGIRRVDWIYVDDVVEGLVACARCSRIAGETVDLGSGCLTDLRTVALTIARIVGCDIHPQFGAIPDRAMEQERVAEAQRSFSQLGWRAKVSLETGLRDTVDWFRTQSGAVAPRS